MKNFTLLFVLLLPFFGFSQLNGTYIISSSNTNVNFQSLSKATQRINAVGVSGPVTFLVDQDQTVTSSNPITINQFANSSNTNTLTIKPNTGKNIKISGDFGNSNTANIIKLYGADNIIFDGSNNNTSSRNMTITNTSLANYDNLGEVHSAIFWISNDVVGGAINNTIKNINFVGSTNNFTSATSVGIVSSGALNMQTQEAYSNSNILISGNSFIKMKIGVWVLGNDSTLNKNLTATQNIFGSTTQSEALVVNGLRLSNTENTLITKNDVIGIYKNSNSSTISGIYVYNKTLNSTITENKFTNIKSNSAVASGIDVNANTTINSNLLIANNYISDIASTGTTTNAGHGIVITNGKNINIYYNTVSLKTVQNNNSAALFIDAGSVLDVRNNILLSSQNSGSGLLYGIYSKVGLASFSNLNYNNYFSQNLGYINGTTYNALNNALGTNSKNINPTFISNSTYKLQDVVANNGLKTALPIATITTDIDNTTRNTSLPTIGAFEISCVAPTIATDYGTNSWVGKVYTFASTPQAETYKGYVTEDAIFDRDMGTAAIYGGTGTFLCDAPTTKYFVSYKMKLSNAVAGKYNITVGGDDGFRLYINGVLQNDVNVWNEHNYITKSILYTHNGGDIDFKLEYFQVPGSARVSFSYGKIEGDNVNLPYGDFKWNVYGFNSSESADNVFTLNANSYAGYYIQNTVPADAQNTSNGAGGWNTNQSPSKSSTWLGAPVSNDNFTISYRRQGFKCGTYILKMENWDDAAAVYINGSSTPIWSKNGYSGGFNDADKFIATLNLSATSKIEIRMKEFGGGASLKMSITEVPVIYTGQSITDSANTSIRIDSDIQITTKLDVCSCTIADGKKLTIKSDAILNVTENITVIGEGKIIVENNGSLVQINDDATYTGNNNSFLLNRTTTPVSRFDYTYWSSPLKITSDFLVGRDQTNPSRKGLSPTTYFDKYYSFNGNTQAWSVIQNGTEVMVPAKGYIVRAPQEFAITNNPSATFTAKFEGVPNNGIVTLPLVIGNNGKSNLIGNPYPSSIDADKFITENAGLIDGTLYFWTHNIALSSTPDANGILQYNPASYISYNKTGSTGSGSTTLKASKNIAAGQGFFINSKIDGNIKFKNSMRVKTATSNSSFYRLANTTQSTQETSEEVTLEKNRVWLNITNAAGAYNETLIGYVSGATNNLEDAYDGVTYASGTAIYTLESSKRLVIQGRALPFVNTDVVPLGFMAATAGEYTIAVQSFDGLFDEQKVYLVDRTDNSIHNLKNESYTFTSTPGTFDSRFEIRYVNDSALGTDNPIITQNDVVVFKSANQISVRANNLTIDTVQVYDITGKLITSGKNINNSTFTTSGLNIATQVVIVKVTLDDNQTISKKVIMN